MEELYSVTMASQTLNEALPHKSREQWELWLQNNRNPARQVAYRVPFERMGGGVFYNTEEIKRVIELERGRQLGTIKVTSRVAEALDAVGYGRPGGTRGRKLECSVHLQYDEEDKDFWVRLIAQDPLRGYALSLDEATALALELITAVRDAERFGKRSKPNAEVQQEVQGESEGVTTDDAVNSATTRRGTVK